MAYIELDLPNSLPDSVYTVVRTGVEPLLQDAHWMLATAPGKPTDTAPPRQLQFPIALVLLATVAGVSKTLLHVQPPNNRAGYRFKKCLSKYFPWCIDPPRGVSCDEAAKILYEAFRNPLVHSLGLNKSSDPAVAIGMAFPGADNAENEKRVERLERLTEKPSSEPCLVVTPEKRVLWLEPFYWGVRKLVERWSRDDEQILHAVCRFSKPSR